MSREHVPCREQGFHRDSHANVARSGPAHRGLPLGTGQLPG